MKHFSEELDAFVGGEVSHRLADVLVVKLKEQVQIKP